MGAKAFDLTLELMHLDDYPAIDAEAYYDGWYGQVQRDLSDALGHRGKRALLARLLRQRQARPLPRVCSSRR